MSGFDPLEAELAQIDREARIAPRRPSLRVLPIALAGVAIVGFAIIVWYAYSTGVREGSETAAPLLRPDGPVKVMPENPGGMEVPHQDKTVFNRIDEQGESGTEVERLLPPPETPRAPPGELAVGPGVTPPDSPGRIPMPAVPQLPSQDPALADVRRVPVPQQPAPPVRLTPETPPAAPAQPQAQVPAPAAPAAQRPAVSTPTPPPAPPAQTATAGTFRIQIGAVKSDAAARQQWQNVSQKNRDILANVAPIVERADLGEKGIFYRIQGGGFETRAAAQSTCDALKSRNVGCFVVR
ncbi:MAG: SPOR domain-containing protein [Alphaproteobacteria bacterium]